MKSYLFLPQIRRKTNKIIIQIHWDVCIQFGSYNKMSLERRWGRHTDTKTQHKQSYRGKTKKMMFWFRKMWSKLKRNMDGKNYVLIYQNFKCLNWRNPLRWFLNNNSKFKPIPIYQMSSQLTPCWGRNGSQQRCGRAQEWWAQSW